MKKVLFSLFFTCILSFLYSQNYKISDYNIEVEGNFWGTTKTSAVLSNYPIDTKTVFTEEELNKYIENYDQNLVNTRLFIDVQVSYEKLSENTEINEVILNIKLVDSNHLLAVPYPKLSSNDGFTLKIKAKDTNFLGTMNTMNADVNINIDNGEFSPGFNFSYDFPFTVAGNKFSIVNDYSLSYTIGDEIPDFEVITGIEYVKPYDFYSYKLSALQYIINDNDYLKYDDNLYFKEKLSFSTPITLKKLKNYTNLNYNPYISLVYNWDFNGISQDNEGLYSPIISFGHGISNGDIDWIGNFKKGYKYSISNDYQYNLNNGDFYPSISFEVEYYAFFKNKNKKYLNKFGLYTDVYGFLNIAHFLDSDLNIFKYGESLGSRLRGRKDNEDLGYEGKNTAPMGIAINIDLPHYMFETNFKKDLFNFEMQVSPFVDIGIFSYEGSRKPAIKDGIYCAGCEVLIFPRKFSSFTIRASLGMDVMKVLKDEDGLKRGLLRKSNYEYFIGIGAHY